MTGGSAGIGRSGRWAPIGDYAVLGNGRTVALVAADGRVDWWPLPALNSPPVFAALLDPDDGGHLELRPVGAFTTERRYVGDSTVLQTTFTTATGRVRVTDALTVNPVGRLPWTDAPALAAAIQRLTGAGEPLNMTVRLNRGGATVAIRLLADPVRAGRGRPVAVHAVVQQVTVGGTAVS